MERRRGELDRCARREDDGAEGRVERGPGRLGQAEPRPGRALRAQRPLGVLSGGEKRRVEIARILFSGTDLLMLDEPTNHLDNDARDWLMGFLRGYRGALLVISHDIELLDESITRILHLDRGGEAAYGTLHEYKGTYSQYQASRAADEARLAKVAAREAAEVQRLQTLVDRFGAKASKASMALTLRPRIIIPTAGR